MSDRTNHPITPEAAAEALERLHAIQAAMATPQFRREERLASLIIAVDGVLAACARVLNFDGDALGWQSVQSQAHAIRHILQPCLGELMRDLPPSVARAVYFWGGTNLVPKPADLDNDLDDDPAGGPRGERDEDDGEPEPDAPVVAGKTA